LDIRIKLPNLKPRALVDLIKTKKEGILKIPTNIDTAPTVVVGVRVKPSENQWTNPEVTPLDIGIKVHSSVNSG
jgi:hypothetical protein